MAGIMRIFADDARAAAERGLQVGAEAVLDVGGHMPTRR